MAGIGGIEGRLRSQLDETDRNISEAFKDLGQLVRSAQEMIPLSKKIASLLRDRGCEVATDETKKFKSHLMELGIEQQVDVSLGSKSNNSYYESLAIHISKLINPLMQHRKLDQLTLSDVYCCFNRARGLDLVSPDDIKEACKLLKDIPEAQLTLVQYASGLLVVQKQTCDNQEILNKTEELVKQAECLTPLQLASRLSIPVQLARQRLQEAEKDGRLCRDESIEGLRFYPNKFMTGGLI